MTPEELNRTIEFIIQSHARLAAAQEQDRIDRLESEKQSLQTEKELKAFDQRLAGLFEMQVRLLESQTQRLDEYEKESREFRDEFRELMHKALASLDRILDKLTDRLN